MISYIFLQCKRISPKLSGTATTGFTHGVGPSIGLIMSYFNDLSISSKTLALIW